MRDFLASAKAHAVKNKAFDLIRFSSVYFGLVCFFSSA